MRGNLAWAATCVGLLLSLTGCGDSRDRLQVSGSVNLAGDALDKADIQFYSFNGNGPPITGAMIREGKYLVPENHGLAPGTYRVLISARELVPPENNAKNPESGLPGKQSARAEVREKVPPQYNLESELKIEVKKGTPNIFDFELDDQLRTPNLGN